MSIEKYLNNINSPNVQPGPFAVRLKYELQKEFFDRKRGFQLVPALSSALAVVFLALVVTFVMKPDLAYKMHYAFSSKESSDLDLMLTGGQPITGQRSNDYLTGDSQSFIPVNDLSKLDSNKSYLIKRVNDNRNKSFYYVSEVKQPVKNTKKPY